jgi:hypothetical protein
MLWALALALSLLPLRAGSEPFRTYMVQPETSQIESFEFQALQGAWLWVDAAETILDPSEACFAVTLNLAAPSYVRARGIDLEGLPTEWSHPIPVPEPGLGMGVSYGACLLALMLSRKSARRRPFV